MLEVLRKRLSLRGRASPSEFWPVLTTNLIIGGIAPILIDQLWSLKHPGGLNAGMIAALFVAPILLMSIAPAIRRLQDTGRSGAWILLTLSGPGAWMLLALLNQPSAPSENGYGIPADN